jgi:transcriptional regulator with XRE-family HTH domain
LVLEARRRGGLTQRELARRAGVSRTTIAEIEAGTRDPGIETLRKVLRGAGLALDARLTALDLHDEVLERTLRRLPAEERARLERRAEQFVGELARGLATRRPLRPSA